jgi:LAS superfamily LD-carboxypeptidase LdcB
MSFFFSLLVIASLQCGNPAVSPEQSGQDTLTMTPATDTVEAKETVTKRYDLDFVMGHFDPSKHPDFELIDTMHADRAGLYLHRETYAAFRAMYDAARKEGIRLQIRSATRNFNYQKDIWERKWTGATLIESGLDASKAYPDPAQRAKMILRYSSMPGASRHHWGTDIDLNAFDNSWFAEGNGLKIYTWLSQHAAEFGFCQPYSAKGEARPFGYEEERWHWSYMPLSVPLTQLAADSLKDSMIKGFQGAEVASKLHIVEHYVLGINAACME